MSSSSFIDEILEAMGWIITGSPMLVVYVIGIIVAIRRYRRHPRISSLALFALVGMMLLAVLPIVYWLFRPAESELFGTSELGVMNMYRIISFAQSSLNAGLFALLLWAIFAGRGQQSGVQGADGQFLPADFFKPGR